MKQYVRIARRAGFRTILPLYYMIKAALFQRLVGNEGLSYVLYGSLFPEVVLRLGGAEVGNGTRINRWLTIHESNGSFRNLHLGKFVRLGKHVFIDLADEVRIGDRANIGMYSRIITHRNFGDSRLLEAYPEHHAPVVIGEDSILSAGATLLAGTRLGPSCIVLPNTVVEGAFEGNVTLAGNPARKSIRRKT